MKHLCLISYEFPPRGGSGVQRPLKLTKYLVRAGWMVTVLTVADPPSPVIDEALLDEIPDGVRVVRAWSLEPARVLQWLRRRRAPVEGHAAPASDRTPAAKFLIRAVQAVFVPDDKRPWRAPAVRAALAANADGSAPFDVIASTGPPHTAHLAAAGLARKLSVPYVIDLRDPWVGNSVKRYVTPLHAYWDRALERRVLGGSAAVVAVTAPISDTYARRYPGVSLHLIRNGFDPEDLPCVSPDPDPGHLVIAYAGTLTAERRPDTFLRGCALAEQRDPTIAETVRLCFAGVGPEIQALAAQSGVSCQIRALGYVSHSASIDVVASADVALLLAADGELSRVSVPGKVFEYLGLGKPILAVVGEGAAAELVREHSGGFVAPYADPSAIADVLLEVIGLWRLGGLRGPDSSEVTPYSRAAQAEQFGAVLESAIETHRRRVNDSDRSRSR